MVGGKAGEERQRKDDEGIRETKWFLMADGSSGGSSKSAEKTTQKSV
jgi:hypothetical protein